MTRFAHPRTALGDLDAETAAALIAAAADVTLVLDTSGLIRDVAVRTNDLAAELHEPAAWRGQEFAATVALDSRPKVTALLADALADADIRWRHVNHTAPGGRTIPILYCCVPLGGEDRLVAFGRDLRDLSALQQRLVAAQQSVERDYSRLQDLEARYRLLFQLSAEAVLVLDAVRFRVLEANPAAAQLAPGATLQGAGLAALLTPESVALVEAQLGAARAGIRVDDVRVRTQDGRDMLVKASFLRNDVDASFLVRLVPTTGERAPHPLGDVKLKLLWAVEQAPDGYVVADDQGRLLTANAAFLDMIQVTPEEGARGRPLDDWIGTSGVDVAVLMANLRQRGTVRFFSSMLRGEAGTAVPVEISAAALRQGDQPSFGFAIRNVAPRLGPPETPQATRVLPRSVEQLTELIGQVPLKELVSEATEVIERLCIEAALELTGNNRASAAEMLGLSRQSLYVKLRRYGVGDDPAEAE